MKNRWPKPSHKPDPPPPPPRWTAADIEDADYALAFNVGDVLKTDCGCQCAVVRQMTTTTRVKVVVDCGKPRRNGWYGASGCGVLGRTHEDQWIYGQTFVRRGDPLAAELEARFGNSDQDSDHADHSDGNAKDLR